MIARMASSGGVAAKMDAFYKLFKENGPKLEKMKNLAMEIKGIQKMAPRLNASPDSAGMRAALADAKRWVEKKGADSVEAKPAWETVEEIVSSDNSTLTMNSLYDECLTRGVRRLSIPRRAVESDLSG